MFTTKKFTYGLELKINYKYLIYEKFKILFRFLDCKTLLETQKMFVSSKEL